MRLSSVVEFVLLNAIVIYLIALVRSDQASRLQYWNRIGFTPSSVYSAFTLRYPAVNGMVSIPGLISLDWVQILLVLLIVVDVYQVASALGGRRRRIQNALETASSGEARPAN
jgi:hypothetical protein